MAQQSALPKTNPDQSPAKGPSSDESLTLVKDQATNKPAAPPQEQPLSQEQPLPQEQASQEELGRVRKILLGPDIVQQQLRGAEADRVREIIFGGQMQEYERRFADLQRDMNRVLANLRQVQDNFNEFEKAQIKRIEALERETRQTDDELRREVDRLRAQESILQQLLTQVRQQEMLGQSVQENSSELRKAVGQQERGLRSLGTTVNEHRDQRDRKLDDLKREIHQAENDLMAELRRVTDRLNDQKTDRKALASMLMEIATRLETGGNVAGLLGGLAGPTQE